MELKTPITILQEYTAQNKFAPPHYSFLDKNSPEIEELDESEKVGEFFCKVFALNLIAIKGGLNKKEAKHNSAAELLKKANIADLSKRQTTSKIYCPVPQPSVIDRNAVIDLLDICVKRMLPKPEFCEVGKSGQSHCPVFTIKCELASLKTHGVSHTKKGAKQIAASNMLNELHKIHTEVCPDSEKVLVPVNQNIKQEVKSKVQTYLEYKRLDDSLKKPMGVSIKGRHNFFSDMDDEIKKPIIKILVSTDMDDKEKFNALKDLFEFPHEVGDLKIENKCNFQYYELCVSFDTFTCMWIDCPDLLHTNVIEYFKIMFGISRTPGELNFKRRSLHTTS